MSQNPPQFIIENREQLLGLLAEAAEIEHNLMCCYLYAAFSLKQGADEGITDAELAAVARWRGQIIHVAVDEMAHLALVANLMAAVGGAPHFGRANFPIPAGYHPCGIVVKLAPFNPATLDHFIFLERPEGSTVADGAGFEPPRCYHRLAMPGRLMPSSQDYDTVGELYHAIRDGLIRLVNSHGEAALFVGAPERQLGPELANLSGLTRVRCLKTALTALDGIVTQGEGAPGNSEGSHFQRFLDIKREYQALLAERPEFVPARPAAHNPVMRHPPTPEDKVWVELRPAADLLDLVNAAYTHMLRLVLQAYAETRGVALQRALVDAGIDLMFVVTQVASALTRLPASSQHPQCTAGMSFATVRGYAALSPCAASDRVLLERFDELASVAARLAPELPGGEAVARGITEIQGRLASGLGVELAPVSEQAPAAVAVNGAPLATAAATAPAVSVAATPRPAAPSPLDVPATASAPLANGLAGAHPIPASTIIDGVEHVEGRALTLKYETKRCIHARHCVLGQPGVFKANVQGPWLDPDATSTEGLVTVAHMCPSGAIRYARKDGGRDEAAPPVNLLQLRENGPLGLRAELVIDGKPAGFRATLCRCGASQNKPFCDGSHNGIGFVATGEPATRPSEPLAARGGVLDIRPQKNGPLVVRGNLEVCAGTGRTVDRVTSVRLCRCGGSANKPFCDGTHATIGFQS
jgi:CDGSH-type Zn-finger protein/uncharacterized Fe-S cluster protein YjdI